MRSEVRAKPLFLPRPGAAAAYFVAVAVERDDMPRTKLVTVVPIFWIARVSSSICSAKANSPVNTL